MIRPSTRLFPQFFQSQSPKNSGLWIFHRDWVIPNFVKLQLNLRKPKGVVIISHGLAEHIQRYEHLAQQLNRAGFACYGMDHQGHGLSDGDRSYVEKFNDYVADLLYFSQGVKDEYDEYQIPIFLLGHSMGGLIASSAALQSQQNAKQNKGKFIFDGGVILSSPFFGVAPEADIGSQYKVIDKTLRFFSRNFPKLQCIALNNKGLSHDPKILYRLQRDTLHIKDMICIRTINEIVDAAANMVNVESPNVEYPYLLFGGGDDALCNPNLWKVFHDQTLSDDKELLVFEGLFHECLNETEPHQKKVCNKIIEWLSQRCEIYEYEKRENHIERIGNVIETKQNEEDENEQAHPFDD